jgi:hypothetical protein
MTHPALHFFSDQLLSSTAELRAMIESELGEPIHPRDFQSVACGTSIDSVLRETIDYTIQKLRYMRSRAESAADDHRVQLGELAANVQSLVQTHKSKSRKLLRALSREGDENTLARSEISRGERIMESRLCQLRVQRLELEAIVDRQISKLRALESEQVRVTSKTNEMQTARQRDRHIPGWSLFMNSLTKFDRQLESEVMGSLSDVMASLAQEVTAAIDGVRSEAMEFQILAMQVAEPLRRPKPVTPVTVKSSFTDAAKEKLVQLKREREEAVRDFPALMRELRH